MRIRTHILALAILLLSCGCSTVVEGRTQEIAIRTSPEGAHCLVKNNGDVIAEVPSTPDKVIISKSKNDILVECSKDGYKTATKKNLADMAISSLGNMALWQLSFVGNAVDNASGAAHKYDSETYITLEKETQPPQTLAQVSAPSATATPALSSHAQAIAQQLVQEMQSLPAPAAGGQLVIPSHTQLLAQQLVQEMAAGESATIEVTQ